MRAIGNNVIIKKIEESNQKTKGGLILTEKQREDVRFQQAKVIQVGDSVIAVKKNDIIYFDKTAAHRIEIKKEPYHVIRQENVVVVL